MRIAQISPVATRVPPKGHGGTERVVYEITEELVRRGHEVTLFASGDSLTSATLNSVCPVHLRETDITPLYGLNPVFLQHLGHAYTLGQQFDIIHDHTGCSGLPFAELSRRPVVMTMHGPIPEAHKPLFQEFRKAHLVAVSHDQQKDHIPYNSAGTIHHGLAMDEYPFSTEHDGYLLYIGQLSESKGAHHAIAVAKRLGLPLILGARLPDFEKYHQYYKSQIEPHLNDSIRWIGEIGAEERNRLMSKAMCFLHPGERETFGLTMVEAMACGAPVIAFSAGAVPEIIEEGKTGYVVKDVEEMALAVSKISSIDRAYCRSYALSNFSAKRMVDNYEALYQKLITQNPLKKN